MTNNNGYAGKIANAGAQYVAATGKAPAKCGKSDKKQGDDLRVCR